MTILIADSSIQTIDRIESLISEADDDLEIHKSLNFQDALRLFTECKPDLVLLDMNWPGNKSFVLLKQIKEINGSTCIIALSHMPVNIIKCKQLGADYFLDKYDEFEKIPGIIKEVSKNLPRQLI